jgi:hypothetical protein
MAHLTTSMPLYRKCDSTTADNKLMAIILFVSATYSGRLLETGRDGHTRSWDFRGRVGINEYAAL